MIAKLAIIFTGFIVAGAFVNLYFLVFVFSTRFLLGIDSELVFKVQYWICFAAGTVTSFLLMRKVWPKSPQQGNPAQEQGESCRSDCA